MSIAIVTGTTQQRDIEAVPDPERPDLIKELRPIEESLRSTLTLTFPHGKTLEIRVSEEDFDKIGALINEANQVRQVTSEVDGGLPDDEWAAFPTSDRPTGVTSIP